MKITDSTVVSLSYKLSVEEGDAATLIDQRDRLDPVEFVFGRGWILPAVEEALLHKTVGFKADILLTPDKAYGEFKPELEQWVPRAQFPKGMEIKKGMKFQTQGPTGDVISVLVKDFKDDRVLLDGNHPLAGAQVRFELEVLRVRAASAEELSTGHVQQRFH